MEPDARASDAGVPPPSADVLAPAPDGSVPPLEDGGIPIIDASFDAGPTTPAAITVDPKTATGAVTAAFAGLSYEKNQTNKGFFSASNTALVAFFKLLGPSLLRVGGNSVDVTTWTPNGAGTTAGQMAKPDVDALAAFLKASGWSVLYGVNMKTSSASLAADEASYAAGALGQSLYGFEIGNEVNNYKSTAVEPTWSYANFKTQWESFHAAMSAAAPGSAFTGPAAVFNYAGYTVPFASDEGKNIVLLTEHYYRGNGAAAGSTLPQLLQPDPGLLTMLKAIGTAATTNKIADGIRLSEANSYFNGGASGVSNSYGTALWVIDFLFANAQNGSGGINFHGGGPGSVYTPIADTGTMVVGARPEFYALLLFTRAGLGPTYATKVSNNGGVDLSAYALGPADGSTSIVVVNKDASKAVQVTIDVGKTIASAAVLRLLGPGLAATTGTITLGGDSVTPSGAWSPTETAAPTSGTSVTVDVSAASAVLVRAR